MARRGAIIQGNPELPEADRVDGFCHPRVTKQLLGHERAQREFVEALCSGKFHHGWLLCGPTGIGKATLAYRMARLVLAGAGDVLSVEGALRALEAREESTTDRLVRALSHPGLLVIRRPYDVKSKRFSASIPVESVRRLRNFFSLSAGEKGWRVVIIDSADEMNVNAANAVLKSLEEPPARCVFLLVCSQPGCLLATIRSRCRTLQMGPLGRDDLTAACAQAFSASDVEMPGDEDFLKLVAMGNGRVGRVLGLFGMGGIEVITEVERFLGQAGNPDWRWLHGLGDRLAPIAAVDRFDLFFELMLERLAKAISARAGGGAGAGDWAPGAEIIAQERVMEWAGLWQDISRAKADVAALNLDRKAFFVETAHKLHALSGGRGGFVGS